MAKICTSNASVYLPKIRNSLNPINHPAGNATNYKTMYTAITEGTKQMQEKITTFNAMFQYMKPTTLKALYNDLKPEYSEMNMFHDILDKLAETYSNITDKDIKND